MCKLAKITVALAVGMLAVAATQAPSATSLRLAVPAADIAIGADETTRTTGPLPPAMAENYI